MVLGLGKCPQMSLTVILGRGTVTVMGEPTMRRSLTPNLSSGGPDIFNHIKVTQGSWAGSGSKKKVSHPSTLARSQETTWSCFSGLRVFLLSWEDDKKPSPSHIYTADEANALTSLTGSV